jgi:hypothetical protein
MRSTILPGPERFCGYCADLGAEDLMLEPAAVPE